jgi:RNA polymerase sigma factor (sigma-70 family)
MDKGMSEPRTDFELLRDFVRHGSHADFADVVRRHLDLVYATAFRKVEQHEAAEEVVQNVFAALARKAWTFAPDSSLPAWLYRTTLMESAGWLRGELRRRRREQTAAELGTTMNIAHEETAFRALLPLLDEALLSLREKDRTALLLRFYESRSLRNVGASLGISEDAAQKRVAAGVEKLAQFFQRRGFRTGTVAAATAALQHSAMSAPASTAANLGATLLRWPAPGGGVTLLARVGGLTTGQKALVCAVLISVPVLWQWHGRVASNRASSPPLTAGTPTAVAAQPVAGVVSGAEPAAASSAPLRAAPDSGEAATDRQSEKEYSIQVRAIVATGRFKAAFIEIQHHSLDRSGTSLFTVRRVIKEGETFDDMSIADAHVRFELLQADAGSGRIRLNENSQEFTHAFAVASPDVSPGNANMRFADVRFADLIDVYACVLNRTVLCHPGMRSEPNVSLAAVAQNQAEAAAVLENLFLKKGYATLLDGEKFALLVPTNRVASTMEVIGQMKPPASTDNAPTGNVDLQNVPLPQVVAIYEALMGRLWIRDRTFPQSISFHNQTPLSRPETAYALEVLFRLQGLNIVPVGDHGFRIVPAR